MNSKNRDLSYAYLLDPYQDLPKYFLKNVKLLNIKVLYSEQKILKGS